MSIQFFPINLISIANTTYIKPTTMIPVIAPDIPPFKYAAISGAINAKELPKYTGDFPFVHNM